MLLRHRLGQLLTNAIKPLAVLAMLMLAAVMLAAVKAEKTKAHRVAVARAHVVPVPASPRIAPMANVRKAKRPRAVTPRL
jgi:hypothetical protein